MSGCVRADSSLKIVKVEVSLSCVNFADVLSDSGQPYYCLYLTNNKLMAHFILDYFVAKFGLQTAGCLKQRVDFIPVQWSLCFFKVCQYGVWCIKDCDLNRSIKC